VVVDWRAPVAEPFYRATGRAAMGLRRRRHFAARGRQLLGIEDELFGDAAAQLGVASDGAPVNGSAMEGIAGPGSLIAALESARTGRLGDIVATIQAEQDEIIRSELPGVLVVQGGPGTGKTVVALHRAAYLLYTYRFPLEGQGVLVVGPNRLFLGYIEQVLPSLGEAGVELVVLADLLPEAVSVRGDDKPLAARVKGDLAMADVLARAVRDRRRPLRDDLTVGFGVETLRLTAQKSGQIVSDARRRARTHNAGRRFVEQATFDALAASSRNEANPTDVRDRLRHTIEVREALEWMWPVLTPAQFLHDLFGSRALLRSAGGSHLTEEEQAALYRPRAESIDDVVFTNDDVPLLDEARALLGPRPRRKGRLPEDDDARTYGHIVVDEAQDLSPMELRMLNRRSLNGSMTIVGDIAQATGAWAHADWSEILQHLPDKRAPRRAELTVGYRIPAPNMELAARVLRVAAPDLHPPTSVRQDGGVPRVITVASPDALHANVAEAVRAELEEVGAGHVAVIVPNSLVDVVGAGLEHNGVAFGTASRHGLDQQVTVVPVGLAKGLELDATVVVEPAAIVEEEAQGLRALYVALTRATKRLAVVHARPLPDCLRE
jgi:DNA helicase IV